MTLNELKSEVAVLGFEKEIELDATFLHAVNRSINQMICERGDVRTLSVLCEERRKSLYVKKFVKSEADVIYAVKAVAFSFISYGNGELTVTDRNGERSYRFFGDARVTKGFLFGDATLRFHGDFRYTVCHLCAFSDLYGDSPDDIAVGSGTQVYDLKKYDANFICFASAPRSDDGDVLSGVKLMGSKMSVGDYRGVICVDYKYAPGILDVDDGESEIDIPSECRHLLPLLVASYVWLDDDASKSQYYMGLYREGMSSLRYHNSESTSCEYGTNGWA